MRIHSILCGGLLLRQYVRSRERLLLWSSLSFVGFAINNVLDFADLVFWPTVDLTAVRAAAGLFAISVNLFGLLWEGR